MAEGAALGVRSHHAAPALIECRGVTKTYRTGQGETKALAPTSFSIAEGEFVGVVGPSGCGKSTLLMIVAGLVPPSGGEVRIRGAGVTKPYTDLGVVFQQDLLLEWRRALDNVLLQAEFRGLPKRDFEGRARELLRLVGLEGFERRYPHELSGGMRQRVAICRALLHDPALLLMDEPFGALDALTRDQLNLDLLDIWQEMRRTILFITHSISEAIFLSDRVLVFGPRPGSVVDEITVDLPRPRDLDVRETPHFGALAKRVRSRFQQMGVMRDPARRRALRLLDGGAEGDASAR
jgi:NitT/TauT family transport system ATP-binding protein